MGYSNCLSVWGGGFHGSPRAWCYQTHGLGQTLLLFIGGHWKPTNGNFQKQLSEALEGSLNPGCLCQALPLAALSLQSPCIKCDFAIPAPRCGFICFFPWESFKTFWQFMGQDSRKDGGGGETSAHFDLALCFSFYSVQFITHSSPNSQSLRRGHTVWSSQQCDRWHKPCHSHCSPWRHHTLELQNQGYLQLDMSMGTRGGLYLSGISVSSVTIPCSCGSDNFALLHCWIPFRGLVTKHYIFGIDLQGWFFPIIWLVSFRNIFLNILSSN